MRDCEFCKSIHEARRDEYFVPVTIRFFASASKTYFLDDEKVKIELLRAGDIMRGFNRKVLIDGKS